MAPWASFWYHLCHYSRRWLWYLAHVVRKMLRISQRVQEQSLLRLHPLDLHLNVLLWCHSGSSYRRPMGHVRRWVAELLAQLRSQGLFPGLFTRTPKGPGNEVAVSFVKPSEHLNLAKLQNGIWRTWNDFMFPGGSFLLKSTIELVCPANINKNWMRVSGQWNVSIKNRGTFGEWAIRKI